MEGNLLMKCIVLAGGTGDRLWPLSRENFPKQFIPLQRTHSLFQETIARNLPFCDEFIIVANKEHQYIVRNQMKAFQCVTYRCIIEEKRRGTGPAVVLACMELEESEIVLVVSADSVITGNLAYRDDMMVSRKFVKSGSIALWGVISDVSNFESMAERYGVIDAIEDNVTMFREKPEISDFCDFIHQGKVIVNVGIFMFRSGRLLNLVKTINRNFYINCIEAYSLRKIKNSDVIYSMATMNDIPEISFEKLCFDDRYAGTKYRNTKLIRIGFEWHDINSLNDLSRLHGYSLNMGELIAHDTSGLSVINTEQKKLIACNGVEDIVIVNTPDVLYVGNPECYESIKSIITENSDDLIYYNKGNITYRQWGKYELISEGETYRIKKLIIFPGKTIYIHSHEHRNEHLTILDGHARVVLGKNISEYRTGEVIVVPAQCRHQISNIGRGTLICIEVDTGTMVSDSDMVKIKSHDLNETLLGYEVEPVLRLIPAFKDYIWGGTKLRDEYGKVCDLERVAESWEISAHPDGQSIVSSGRHKGMLFGDYLKLIGMENLGWKCNTRDEFPLLIKLIDAQKNLSIQVHPNDEYALEHEHEYGKNEMWYVLEAESESYIYCGFNRNVSRREVLAALTADIANETEIQPGMSSIEKMLNKVPVKKGDVFFIEAGTVHAIQAGVVICEIQQSSNATYRLYDYNRRDGNGNLRELHIEKALDVLNYNKYAPQVLNGEIEKNEQFIRRVLARCKYFEAISYKIDGECKIDVPDDSFMACICVSGSGKIILASQIFNAEKGNSFIFLKTGEYFAVEGIIEVIVIFV